LLGPDVLGVRTEGDVTGFGRQSLDEVRSKVLAVPVGEKNLIDDLLVLLACMMVPSSSG
jgi:hypothetical protein